MNNVVDKGLDLLVLVFMILFIYLAVVFLQGFSGDSVESFYVAWFVIVMCGFVVLAVLSKIWSDW